MSKRTTRLVTLFAASAASLAPLASLAAPNAAAVPSASCHLGVIKTVKAGVGGEADAVAYDQANGEIYVTGTDGVEAINGKTYKQVAVIPTGKTPDGLAVNPVTDTVYVSNLSSSTLSVINGKTNKVTATVHLAQLPFTVAVDQRGGKILVTGLGGDIWIINASTNRVTGTIRLGDELETSAFNQVTGLLYATNGSFPGDPGTIFVVNVSSRRVVRIHPGGSSRPFAVAVNPQTNTVYVTDDPNPGPNGIFVINGSTSQITTKILTEFSPDIITLNPKNDLMYVITETQGGDAVMEFDGRNNKLIATQPVNSLVATFAAVNIPSSYVYVIGSGELVVLASCR